MESCQKDCVYCGEPILTGAPFEMVFDGPMHPECAIQFKDEWEALNQTEKIVPRYSLNAEN